ncbi:chromosomal replication initiator DnaA [Pseudooceanicola sp. HF7]|uniref:chromosomal replication initiator DnaA n=1 Tax=Pseudooceanicola sp. HF7 TaxID=2721560 RepID=UPI001430A10F|nr:chromosomal replication initiator DnaA [Pseudooceanicola sp. HF7]NIZ10250.1 chromosomal replication initiator DnaA [Pseudooceanicola sp. HF7]
MPKSQPILPLLSPTEAMGKEDFILGPGNEVAFAMLDNWPAGWSANKVALWGPEGSGKTHLTRIWARKADASLLDARELTRADIPDISRGPVAVENVPEIAGDWVAEEALFHLHNLVLAEGNWLLVTGREAPAAWGLTLPDLDSRMQAAPAVSLAAPDDALLFALFIKFFTDRQIMPSPDVIPYLLPRIERSFRMVRHVAEALDAQSLADQRPVTRAMATRVLKRLAGDDNAP